MNQFRLIYCASICCVRSCSKHNRRKAGFDNSVEQQDRLAQIIASSSSSGTATLTFPSGANRILVPPSITKPHNNFQKAPSIATNRFQYDADITSDHQRSAASTTTATVACRVASAAATAAATLATDVVVAVAVIDSAAAAAAASSSVASVHDRSS